MAWYKNPNVLHHFAAQGNAYDLLHNPGVGAPFSGIYKCHVCDHEAVSTLGHPLPPEHHGAGIIGQHTRWQLIVAAHQV